MALTGLTVIEFAGLAPAPFAGLVLSHHGANVVRVDRPGQASGDVLCAGKRSVVLDLKSAAGRAAATRLVARADVLIDPFRPGVMEKMGLGPGVFHAGLNDRLVYARIAGFPADGPYKTMAGHDVSYLALSGILSILPGNTDKPAFPLNLLADIAGGGLLTAVGILLALFERAASGRGQVVDLDMVSGTRYISSFPFLHFASGPASPFFGGSRGSNLLDGGAPFYDTYVCADGKWVSVACLEPAFFATFIATFTAALDTDPDCVPALLEAHANKESWPTLRRYVEDGFKTMPQDHWARLFHGSDACVVPVLSPHEAAQLDSSRSVHPAPHPRLSRTPPSAPPHSDAVLHPGRHTRPLLLEFGFSSEEISRLDSAGAFGDPLDQNKL